MGKIINWEIKRYPELEGDFNGPAGYALGVAEVKDAWGDVKTVPAWIKVVADAAHIIRINKKGDWNGLYEIKPFEEEENPVVATFVNAEKEAIGEIRRNDTCKFDDGGEFGVGLLYEYD
jgi:hypothetical protein